MLALSYLSTAMGATEMKKLRRQAMVYLCVSYCLLTLVFLQEKEPPIVQMVSLFNVSLENQHDNFMLSNGDFGVQRTTHHGFSQVPVDQTIEQTLNRSTKTKGGIVGLNHNISKKKVK